MPQTIDIKLQFRGQSITPDPEIQHLHLFVGKWNIEGETYASNDAPALKVAGVDTYEWMPGKFFLVHNAKVQVGDEVLDAIELISYDAPSQTYACYRFDSYGNSDLFQADFHDHNWTMTGKSSRFTGVFGSTDNTLTGQWEQSSDGLNWVPWMHVKLTKIL